MTTPLSFTQKIVYWIVKIILKIMGMVPYELALKISAFLGRLAFLIDKRHRKITLSNLTIAFGDEKSASEIKKLAIQVFANLFLMLFEIGRYMDIKPKDFSRDFKIKGVSEFKKAIKKNKGFIFILSHFGNWELLAIIGRMLEQPTDPLYRPLDMPAFDKLFFEIRTRFGAAPIPVKRGAMKKIVEMLKQGRKRGIGILIDQRADWYEGVFVDFFNKQTCAVPGLALIALRTEAPVLPLFLIRDGKKFRAEICPEIPLIRTGDKTKDIELNTAQYNKVIEKFIRRYPDHWFWVHDRWKTKAYSVYPRQLA